MRGGLRGKHHFPQLQQVAKEGLAEEAPPRGDCREPILVGRHDCGQKLLEEDELVEAQEREGAVVAGEEEEDGLGDLHQTRG